MQQSLVFFGLTHVIIPLILNRLFLDHDIIFYLSKVLNTFENTMENGTFAPRSKCSIFHNIFKYIVFQRRQKGVIME